MYDRYHFISDFIELSSPLSKQVSLAMSKDGDYITLILEIPGSYQRSSVLNDFNGRMVNLIREIMPYAKFMYLGADKFDITPREKFYGITSAIELFCFFLEKEITHAEAQELAKIFTDFYPKSTQIWDEESLKKFIGNSADRLVKSNQMLTITEYMDICESEYAKNVFRGLKYLTYGWDYNMPSDLFRRRAMGVIVNYALELYDESVNLGAWRK